MQCEDFKKAVALKNDGIINIALGRSRKEKIWTNEKKRSS
ncbi:hypothetical protein SAMN05443428_1153 [Caloramator quimbayensis]|uniref:Uncharacterized protein n=1 Tax=Caloramator quimbayensis TaxID=1147123 RepID=A0A1T4XXU2_9CLOT|nr:hypothetical protein SAMN05443428_1153 [Caloramator quimbayensis]